MKIVFAGSPEFAVPALEALIKSGRKPVAVITNPDKPKGRKRVLTPTPVKEFAVAHGIEVLDFPKIKEHVGELKSLDADMMYTCAYGQILTQAVLDCFPFGVWNIHASLLPLFRGASPIQSAILAGESHTGVTVMKTELSLDTGAMLLVKRIPISNETCGELSAKLAESGAEAIVEAAELLERGDTQLLLQDEARATYCKKIEKSDCRLDFSKDAATICRAVKAFSPEPSAFCMFGGAVLNILNAETSYVCGKSGEVIAADKNGVLVGCGEGSLLITRLQPAGGKVMRAADFVNGRKIKVGDRLD